MLPNKVDIAMSMLEREIINAAGRFGFGNNPMLQMGINAAKQMYGDRIRTVVASIVGSDESMDAGADTLKEVVSEHIDSFQERLKAKMAQKEANNAHNDS